ncbi:33906_t:CDS:2 [Racocetra persica]|uniref:33906_t:CDS:1 n=1 Tax=Racocetra persica TaxID=160502 RepID=A0ACA9KZ38_9GLOM|nr:33906_t:CDS:2 [Racocetra persica]
MYTVSLKYLERYCLCLLLLYVPGAESFEDLKTVNGEPCNTFYEAASEDYIKHHDVETAISLAYNDIDKMLQPFQKSLSNTFKIHLPKIKNHTYSTESFNKQEEIKLGQKIIATNLLPNSTTVHSHFKLYLNLSNESTLQLSATSQEAKIIRQTKVFIWDEAPIASNQALDIIDSGLHDLTQNNAPFGEKIMILGGDFRQVLPIV